MNCRICNNTIKPFMTFGKMPIANSFSSTPNPKDEYFFELAPAFCDACKTFQIVEQPDPEKMFHDHYAFFSRTSMGIEPSQNVADEARKYGINTITEFFTPALAEKNGLWVMRQPRKAQRY